MFDVPSALLHSNQTPDLSYGDSEKPVALVESDIGVDLKIDKLSVVVDIPEEEHQPFCEGVWDAAKELAEGFSHPFNKGAYNTALNLHVPEAHSGFSKDSIRLTCDPKKAGTAFVRLEFNPDRLGVNGVDHLRASCGWLFNGGYQQVVNGGKVTRLDVAVDISNVSVEDLIVTKKGVRKYCCFGKNGFTETSYLGAPKKSQATVYDKAKELAAKHKQPPAYPLTRIEMRLCPNVPLKDLVGLKNPLLKVAAYDLATSELPLSKAQKAWFGDSCRIRGINGAIEQLPADERPAYLKALKGASSSWWKPEEIWTSWPTLVAALGLLKT